MGDIIIAAMVMILAASVAVFQLVYQLPRHWDGRLRAREADAWTFFPYSEEFKAGLKRAVPVSAIGIHFFTLGGIAMFGTALMGEHDPSGIFLVLLILSIVPLLLFFPLMYLVIYHNRPKFLIAPHYRDELGVVQFRRAQGRLARSRVRLLVEVAIWLAVIAVIIGLIALYNS